MGHPPPPPKIPVTTSMTLHPGLWGRNNIIPPEGKNPAQTKPKPKCSMGLVYKHYIYIPAPKKRPKLFLS